MRLVWAVLAAVTLAACGGADPGGPGGGADATQPPVDTGGGWGKP